MTINFATNKVDISLLGEQVKLDELSTKIGKTYFAKRYGNALSINTPKGQVFVFNYGVSIAWGISESKKSQLDEMLYDFVKLPNKKNHDEHFEFDITDSASVSVKNDHLVLPDAKTMTLLAVSHALAQSAKLSKLEIQAERTIKDNTYLSLTLAKTGKLPLSRKKLSMLGGVLLATKSDILLHLNLLESPAFFWEFPEHEPKYLTVSRYLDLPSRVDLLKVKLSNINELQEMLTAEQSYKHFALLAWLISMLIALEIVQLLVF